MSGTGRPGAGGRLRVGINCAILQRGVSGTATAARVIADVLDDDDSIKLVRLMPRRPLTQNRWVNAARSITWDFWSAGRAVADLDVLISPCNTGRAPRGTPHLLVVHDTMVLDHPELFDRAYALYARAVFGASVASATAVLAASRYAAACILRHWPSAPPVAALGWPATVRVDAARHTGGAPPWTVLMVGATEPHKNHRAGIEAVRLARLMTGAPLRLEIIGPEGRAEDGVRSLLEVVDPTGEWVVRRGRLPAPELADAYRRAWALLQPSIDEGFGLPLLEAAAYALPVVHTGAGSMSEVIAAGGAGGHDAYSLAEALRTLLDEPAYRAASAASLNAARCRSRTDFAKDLVTVLRTTAAP